MENVHLIEVKYLGATNTQGSRVKITSKRFNQSKTIPYNHSFDSIADIAANFLKSKGFKIIGKAEAGKDADALISTTFEPIK